VKWNIIRVLPVFIILLFGDWKDSRDTNIWYKVSEDPSNPGRIISLDMSRGYSVCDENYIYILVLDTDSVGYTIVFPSDDAWWVQSLDTLSIEIQKFENYFRN
tara:strand:+ start:2930 stop:3238 length:309 start_codon:yes stop_codon:yes gene_type:complete